MTIKIDFVHIHTHDCHSKRDSVNDAARMVKKVAMHKMKALAITNHGNVQSIPQLFKASKQEGIKAIAGQEFYMADARREASPHFHQIILAKNKAGYQNLIKLSSEAFMSGFYNKPRIDWELLEKYGEGLILTSTCLAGMIPQAIMEGDYNKAKSVAKRMHQMFGDDYYLEIQTNTMPEQKMVNSKLIELSKELGIQLVATADVHYLDKEDAELHKAMLCLGRGKKMLSDSTPEYGGEENYFLQTPKEVFLYLKKQGIEQSVIVEAMNNTGKIADKCDFELGFEQHWLPHYEDELGEKDLNKVLSRLVTEGFKRKLTGIPKSRLPVYVNRVKYELGVIKEKGFADYFLIVADMLKYAKSKGIIVGGGRGSSAGSLVAYLLDITEVDSVKYGLLFERFLDVTRKKMPDIDTDIEDSRRMEVYEYLQQKYGKEKVCQIANYGKMSPKLAFKNAMMVYDIPFGEAQKISDMIPDELGISIEDAYRLNPALKAMKKKKVTRNDGKTISLETVFRIAEGFENLLDKTGKHAAGVLVTPKPVDEIFPIYGSDSERICQFDKDDVEELGGVKLDLLGLKTLTMLGYAVRSIHKETGKLIDVNEIANEPTDPKVYQLITSGNTHDCFQINSDGMIQLCKRVKPTSFEHLVAINALYRPPALASGDTWRYADIKNGDAQEHYSHPDEKPITGETFGVITYQEHVMLLTNKFAGWDLGFGDKLRKMKQHELEELRGKWLEDCAANGYTNQEPMNEIWDRIVRYMGYGFNKSHGVAYSLITYLTAWMKVHYPEHWLGAQMTVKMGEQEKIAQAFEDIKKAGFSFQAPDVNISEEIFTVHDGKITFPMGTIKGVGDKAVEQIIMNRPHKSLEDLMEKVDLRLVSKRAMQPLILAGAFDSLYPDKTRKEIFALYLQIKKEAKKVREAWDTTDWNDTVQAENEKEYLGVYLTKHPMEDYGFRNWGDYQDGEPNALMGGKAIKVKTINDKKGQQMAFVTIETLYGIHDAVVFAHVWKKYKDIATKGAMLMVEGRKDGNKVIANSIKGLG